MAESESKAEAIRRLAYERWEQTGRQNGLETEHWQWAEAEYAQQLQPGSNGQPASQSTGSPSPGSNGQPKDDVSAAPESGTVRDQTSGNQTAAPQDRPVTLKPKRSRGKKATAADDPAVAGEER